LKEPDFPGHGKPFDNPFWGSRYLLSAMARECYEKAKDERQEWLVVEAGEAHGNTTVRERVKGIQNGDQGNLARLIAEAQMKAPKTEDDKKIGVLSLLHRHYIACGSSVFEIDCNKDYPLFFLKGPEFLTRAVRFLVDDGYVRVKSETMDGTMMLEITSDGCQFCERALRPADSKRDWVLAPLNNLGGAVGIVARDRLEKLERIREDNEHVDFLIRMCSEINSCFLQGHLLATLLVMRALLNYVPPIFGCKSFSSVAAQSPVSLKEQFETLEEGLRKVADYQTHRTMKPGDCYPSRAQVEPYKPAFELLIDEVIRTLRGTATGAQQR